MDTTTNFYELLHDGTVNEIVVDWPNGTLSIRLKLSAPGIPGATLVAQGLIEFKAPRREPWGPSSSINTASFSQAVSGSEKIDIELQSGEVLSLEARSIEFTPD